MAEQQISAKRRSTLGNSAPVADLDFSKAFDSVTHEKLLQKLQAYGIEGDLLKWCSAFLTDRSQSVRVGHSLSPSVPVISGKLQGSVLAPLFFRIYVNDLPEMSTGPSTRLFAMTSKSTVSQTL